MELLQNWFENSPFPFLSAFILGLMTAISPCPLATNITAIGFISKDIKNGMKVFTNGLIYTLGRGITYSLIGLLFYFGLGQFSSFIQEWGEKILGPLLILFGIIMLGILNLNIRGLDILSNKMNEKPVSGFWGVLLLGIVFALAFCPYSGVLYFMILIPMTINSASGLYLPLIFAVGTGLPVIVFSWIIAFSVGSIGKYYDKIKIFEVWFRRSVAVLFIGVGIYYVIILFF